MSQVLLRYQAAAVLAVLLLWGLSVAQNVFAPVLTALVIALVLSPLADRAERAGAPAALVAVLVLCSGIAVMALAVLVLEPPVSSLLAEAPRIWDEVRLQLAEVQGVMAEAQRIAKDVEDAVTEQGDASNVVQTRQGGDVAAALRLAPVALAQVMIFVGTLFFFILTRRETYGAIASLGETEEIRREIADRLLLAERFVARYFAAITAINIGLGVATYTVMAVIGMPSPLLWGVAAALLNFLPYLGPAVVIASLGVAGVVVFDGPVSTLPALAFLTRNIIEGQFVTPALVGRSLRINPLLVFVALVFWIWLWGPGGGFVAIPVLLVTSALMGYDPQRAPARVDRPARADL